MIRYLLLTFALCAAIAAQSDSTLTPRERRLANQLKSPCCWSESLLVHSSPDARRLRAELATMVRQGKSDEQILHHFVTTFGSRILRDPPGRNQLWLHLLPFLAAALGLAIVVAWIYHARPPQPTTA